VRVRSAETMEDLETDVLRNIKFSTIEWLKDGSGFFYLRFPASSKIKNAESRMQSAASESSSASSDDGEEAEPAKDDGSMEEGTETDINTHQMVCFHAIGTN